MTIEDLTEDAEKLANSAREFAEVALKHASRFYATELNYSSRSVGDVELILGRLHDKIPRSWLAKKLRQGPTPEEIYKMGLYYGSYVGEVLRLELGGEWRLVRVSGSEPTMALRWSEGNLVFPVSKAHKRLFDGEDDNVEFFYKVVREKRLPSGNGEPQQP